MKLTIVGGGPGGYTAAFDAAERGCAVTLIERTAIGGTCLNRGCIPTKTLRASADAAGMASRLAMFGVAAVGSPTIDLAAVRARKESVISILGGGLEKACARHGITLVRGSGRILDARTVEASVPEGRIRIDGDAVILATGSSVLELPGIAYDHKYILSSDDALELGNIPARVLILGGGVVGCELACIYRAFGSAVTVVEGQDRLLPMPSVDADVSVLLHREMRKQKISVMTGRTLQDVAVRDGVVRAVAAPSPFVEGAAGNAAGGATVEADALLVTVGRAPATEGLGLEEAGIAVDRRGWITVDEHLETTVPGVYAIGDALGPSHVMLAHVAAMEGHCVVDRILGNGGTMDYAAIPSAVFTLPEIGEVGLTESQARNVCGNVACGQVQMRELGKAHAMGELAGFFKIVADGDTGRLLGVHIAGAHASDLIAEAGLALSMGATVQDIATAVHAHPTLAEGLHEAARTMMPSVGSRP